MTMAPDLLSVVNAVARRGGVARVSALRRDGHRTAGVAESLRRGDLVRVRRDWVALPGADPQIVAAARAGVVISCISLARRLGLWVREEDRVHVAAEPRATGGKPARVRVHWARPLVPRDPEALTDSVENALVLIATCQPFESALATWDSAVHQGMVTPEGMGRLPLPPAARTVLASVDPLSESGLETLFRVRLKWLRVRILTQVWIAGHRCDFLVGERLVVQTDGGHHVGAQRASDIAHDAQLMLLGYHVIRLTYAQVIDDWPAVQDVIARAVAQGLHHPH